MSKLIMLICATFGLISHAGAQALNGPTPESAESTLMPNWSFKYEIHDRKFAANFANILILGHSLSSNIMPRVLFVDGFGKGPGTLLAKKYAGTKETPANIAEGIGNLETGLSKMARISRNLQTSDLGLLGWRSTDRSLPIMKVHYFNSTAIVGVDAFYMDVVFDTCSDFTPQGVETVMNRFITQAYQDGKVTVLGNVPKEDWSRVSYLAQAVLKNNNEDCRKVINEALSRQCKSDRNCYIADLEGAVDELNTTGQLVFKNGVAIKAREKWLTAGNQIRPDGINLGPVGSYFLMDQILFEMAKNPPTLPVSSNQPR